MFKNTVPFSPKFDSGTNKIRVGVAVPPNGVNLAHYYCPPLNPLENVIIGDNSGFILENTQQQQSTIMNGAVDNILVNQDGTSDIDSELIAITDKFYNDTPLYYEHKVSKYFYGEKDNMEGTYYGQSIKLLDYFNKKLPSTFAYKIILKKAAISDSLDKNIYEIYIYTSFQIENNYRVKCVYNSIEKNKYGEWVVLPNDEEVISPSVFFSKAKSVLEAITSDKKYYLERSNAKIKSSKVYMKSTFKDVREPHCIKAELKITFKDQSTKTVTFPKDYDSSDFYQVYNYKSALESEKNHFSNGRQILTNKTISELMGGKEIISIISKVIEADRSKNAIRLYVRPDGKGKLYAETSLDTGLVSNVIDKHFKKIGDQISIGYGVRFKDRNPIKLLYPREEKSLDVWHVRVQNGRFSKRKGDTLYHYYLPEYYNQVFDQTYGMPYRRIVGEKPTVISKNSIKLKNAPLYVDNTNGQIKNLKAYRLDELGNKWEMKVESWNDIDGMVTFIDIISENDNIFIDYVFEEESYTYRGYLSANDLKIPTNVFLDVNPNQHHRMTDTSNLVYTDLSTFRLISSVIYFYIKPAVIETTTGKIYNSSVLSHRLQPHTEEEMNEMHLELIGVIYVRPNSSQFSLDVIDTRTRGGGLIEEIDEAIRRDLEPESDFYWDIGYWDGEPYSENSVIIVKLDKKLLVQYGGRFTESEITIAVNKHMAAGTFAIIEYVTSYEDDTMKIRNLQITKNE